MGLPARIRSLYTCRDPKTPTSCHNELLLLHTGAQTAQTTIPNHSFPSSFLSSKPGRMVLWEKSLLCTAWDGMGRSMQVGRASAAALQPLTAPGLERKLQTASSSSLLTPPHPSSSHWECCWLEQPSAALSSSCCAHQEIHGSPHEKQCSAQEQLQWWLALQALPLISSLIAGPFQHGIAQQLME